jgi:hypothetical protein
VLTDLAFDFDEFHKSTTKMLCSLADADKMCA